MISLSWKNPSHQDYMNEAYNTWGESQDKWEFIKNLKSKTHRDAVILGNLNYQVKNGGFYQWWENDYGPRDYEYLIKELLPPVNINSFQIVLKILKRVIPVLKKMDEINSNTYYVDDDDDDDDEFNSLESIIDSSDDKYYEINKQFMEDVEKYLLNPLMFTKRSNQEWFTGDSQDMQPEDRTYVNPLDDNNLRRTNPPNYDKGRDWYTKVNDKVEDSELSYRDGQTSLTSGASKKLSWKERLRDQLQAVPKISEAKQRVKEIIKLLLTAKEAVEEWIRITKGVNGYRIRIDYDEEYADLYNQIDPDDLFERGINLSEEELKYKDSSKSRIKVASIEKILDVNEFEDCLVKVEGYAYFIIVPYISQKQSSWRDILSDFNPAPGFIPTNDGMQTEEDIFDSLDYGSYAANRDYDKTTTPYGKELNPDYNPEESRLRWRKFWMNHGGWSEEKLDKFEKRYYREQFKDIEPN